VTEATVYILAKTFIASAMTVGMALPAIAALPGCSNRDAEAQAATNARVAELRRGASWEESPVALPQDPVSVAQGSMPLAYIFDLPGRVQVTDLTTKAKLVVADVPQGQTLVRVDAKHGVIVGKNNVYPGPLAADHQYGIFAVPTTPGTFRQGVGAPGDTPKQ
jgi:hypothetical protein